MRLHKFSMVALMCASSVAFGAATTSSTSSLSELSPAGYVGLEGAFPLDRISRKQGSAVKKHHYNAKIGVLAGVNLNEYSAVELKGRFSQPHKVNGQKLKSYRLDGTIIGKYPVVTNTSVFGGIGYSYVWMGHMNKKSRKMAPHIVGGVEYSITESLSARAALDYLLMKRMQVNNVKPRDNFSGTIGLKYTFT